MNTTSAYLDVTATSLLIRQTDASNSMAAPGGRVKVVADYALQQKLGSGSFAVVYKGVRLPQSQASQEVVAIKAISRTSEKLTKKVLQNLEIEINILRSYRHRNIVCMHDVQKTERHFYLILEYCAGGDVTKLIRTRQSSRLSEGLARRLMRDLASGLRFLWGQELIHRDLKPQNLLLTGPLPLDEVNDPGNTEDLERRRQQENFPSDQFALKIADFGFARHLQSASLAETLCGSPLYMAPEILQHHRYVSSKFVYAVNDTGVRVFSLFFTFCRYDAKADLWSVGTVLFEMITGQPPFHGENQFDLLRNIQRKAVRLPPDVRVSKECVTLLRLLLNRNPLSRAGFAEFFAACDAFVALGCNGVTTDDEGTYSRQNVGLVSIPEDGATVPGTESTLTSRESSRLIPNRNANIVTPTLGPAHAAVIPSEESIPTSTLSRVPGVPALLKPLIPSPPTSMPSPIYSLPVLTSAQHGSRTPWPTQQATEPQHQGNRDNSSEENSFVMVEHSSLHKSLSSNALTVVPNSGDPSRPTRQNPSPSTSAGYFIPRNPLASSRGEYMVVRQPKGMLSTSPGTGGALMGLMSGKALLGRDEQYALSSRQQQLEMRILTATKMLAAAEDVGRRAISVAHLGDQRAYSAMRLSTALESTASSLVSATPMDGIQEENDGTVTDDSTCADMVSTSALRRRRSSSATDKSMPDPKVAADLDEMPFALNTESSSPVFTSGLQPRSTPSKSTTISQSRASLKPTPMVIRLHFNEALSCYVKALKMLKGAIAAAQNVSKDFGSIVTLGLDASQYATVQVLQNRCEVTATWLGGQFRGVLERGDATNVEIGKLSVSLPDSEAPNAISVEELIFNHALSYGREGAVKQLLGQFEPARSCYRTAGLLAETILMETTIGADDRAVLEEYVDGFAARINELDDFMLQQSRMAASNSLPRQPAVVSVIGQSYTGPSLSINPPPTH